MGEPDSYACDYFLCEQADPDVIEGLRKEKNWVNGRSGDETDKTSSTQSSP